MTNHGPGVLSEKSLLPAQDCSPEGTQQAMLAKSQQGSVQRAWKLQGPAISFI